MEIFIWYLGIEGMRSGSREIRKFGVGLRLFNLGEWKFDYGKWIWEMCYGDEGFGW